MIDLSRKITGVDKVSYVAHSQGTSLMFYALAKNEAEFLERVNVVVDLAPAAQVGQQDLPLKNICSYIWYMEEAFYLAGI